MGLVLWYIKKYVLCLNNREVAQRLGEVHTTIGNYELGKTKVTIQYLESFCKEFNLNIDMVWSMYMIVRETEYLTSRESAFFLREFDKDQYLKFVSTSLDLTSK